MVPAHPGRANAVALMFGLLVAIGMTLVANFEVQHNVIVYITERGMRLLKYVVKY